MVPAPAFHVSVSVSCAGAPDTSLGGRRHECDGCPCQGDGCEGASGRQPVRVLHIAPVSLAQAYEGSPSVPAPKQRPPECGAASPVASGAMSAGLPPTGGADHAGEQGDLETPEPADQARAAEALREAFTRLAPQGSDAWNFLAAFTHLGDRYGPYHPGASALSDCAVRRPRRRPAHRAPRPAAPAPGPRRARAGRREDGPRRGDGPRRRGVPLPVGPRRDARGAVGCPGQAGGRCGLARPGPRPRRAGRTGGGAHVGAHAGGRDRPRRLR